MSEFQQINETATATATASFRDVASKKQKRVSSKSKLSTKKFDLVIEDEDEDKDEAGEGNDVFIEQVYRKDILANMLANKNLTGKQLFHLIIKEKKELCDERRQGWIFETLCLILVILKCVENLHYTEILDGQLQSLKQMKNINSLLKIKVDGGGNNIVDLSIKQTATLVSFSIKYKNKYSETDVSKIDNTITKQNITEDYKIGLFVKDKELVIKHKYKNKMNIDKQLHDKIIENCLLFDEKDIIKALDVFCQRFSGGGYHVSSVDDFIEFINAEYLLSPRQQLTKKLHQKMTELKFIKSFLANKHKMWCIGHKPRSGKSITMLLICKYLLEHGYKKILIMTSVPATINSFMNDLEKYIDFKGIDYKLQEEFDTIDETFNGIVFCSVQYLKVDGKSKKKEFLKKMGFDAIITDEAHLGSSTDKTKTEILDVDSDVEEIRQTIKLNIFASGTADKTKKYYGIHTSCIYEWEIEDEGFMKELIKLGANRENRENREKIIDYMVNRHGPTFLDCLEDETLNKDYSKHPTQVLMKHSIPQLLIEEINAYNAKYGTSFGYNCGSLFALKQIINEKGELEYAEEFELCKTTDGIDILKGFFDSFISTNRMRKSIMKEIENTQTSRGSRKSTIENPLLFIMYLPTHTRNNTIDRLQKTFKQFLEAHNLWSDYNIEYSNSIEDSGNIKEEYNEYIQTIMNNTKTKLKKGCILLLGDKGSVGITYHDCDVTISLDDGHNISKQKQRVARGLTEAPGKTIGINVDMNIQRTYLSLIDMIQKHRKSTKTTKTNAEILYYLFEHNIFLFDPQHINNGKMTTIEIMSYYQKEAENIMREIDDTLLLEDIVCDDELRDIIKTDFQKTMLAKKINKDLEGEQQDCPKGDKTKVQIDAPASSSDSDSDSDTGKEDKNEALEEMSAEVEVLINQTYEMCKSFLFPLLALISKSCKIFDFKEIFTNEKTGKLIISLLKDKKIELNNKNYSTIVKIMSKIIDSNSEIVNNIREIYSIAPANKLRQLIEKHFIPTIDEKKQNAEVPTPAVLVDEMLNTLPEEFWKTPQKVFEPCCGKGNFVLGIFDNFYKGLEEIYPDEIDRCRVIMTECIYYSDLSTLNVFITTELLKCHVQSYCGLEELDFEFNNHTGDTLEFDSKTTWHIDGFDAVIGNPPYQDANATGDNKLYLEFIKYSLGVLNPNKYLLFVTPTNIKNYITNKDKNRKYIDNFYEILYLSLNTANRHFKGISTYFAYFLLKNNVVSSCTTRVEFLRNKNVETDEITIYEKQELPLCLSNMDFTILNKCSNILSKVHDTFDIKKATYNVNSKPTLQRIRLSHLSNGDISRNMVDCYKYPIIDKINKSKPFPGDVYYNKHLMNDHGQCKIIMCTGGYLMPSYDAGGVYNLSDNMIYMLCDTKEKYDGFVVLVNSKLIKYINLITMTDNIHGRDVVIQNMKALDLEQITNDADIYKLYDLSESEVEVINKTISK